MCQGVAVVNKSDIAGFMRRIRSLIVVLAIQVLLVSFLIWQRTRNLNSPAVSVRLLSSGNAIWGDNHVLLDEIKPSLTRARNMLRKEGFTPKFLIERYTDTKTADIKRLTTIAHDAGFDTVEVHTNNWASPRRPPPD